MLGAIIIALIIVIGIPVSFMVMGAAVSFVLGWTLGDNAEQTHPDSELTDLNY